jgi:hypothetical protein
MSTRPKPPKRLENFLATSRDQHALVRQAIAEQAGQRKVQALGAFDTLAIEKADDHTGEIRLSDASIARFLGVEENTWYALRDILIEAKALRRVEKLRANPGIDPPVTYVIPCMPALSSRVTPSRLDVVTTSKSEAIASRTTSTVADETRETASRHPSSSEVVNRLSPAEIDPQEVQENTQELLERFNEGTYVPPRGPEMEGGEDLAS